MCRVSPHGMSYQEIRGRHWKKGRVRKVRIKQHFYTMQRINPLGSRVSITSVLYCRGGLTTHGVPRAIGDHGAPVSLPKLKKAY
ncbi:unnamed protein product, partial [Staurois parvus]